MLAFICNIQKAHFVLADATAWCPSTRCLKLTELSICKWQNMTSWHNPHLAWQFFSVASHEKTTSGWWFCSSEKNTQGINVRNFFWKDDMSACSAVPWTLALSSLLGPGSDWQHQMSKKPPHVATLPKSRNVASRKSSKSQSRHDRGLAWTWLKIEVKTILHQLLGWLKRTHSIFWKWMCQKKSG